jgi:hypothetical protein
VCLLSGTLPLTKVMRTGSKIPDPSASVEFKAVGG